MVKRKDVFKCIVKEFCCVMGPLKNQSALSTYGPSKDTTPFYSSPLHGVVEPLIACENQVSTLTPIKLP